MYMQLIHSLAIIGYATNSYVIDFDTPIEGHLLQFYDMPKGVYVEITITQTYHAFPGLTCYFVTYRNDNGDFTCCAGTPHIDQVLFDLGAVMAEVRK